MTDQRRITSTEIADIYDVPPWLVDTAIPVPSRVGRIAWSLRSRFRRLNHYLRFRPHTR